VFGNGPHIIKFVHEEDHTKDNSARALCACDIQCMLAVNPLCIVNAARFPCFGLLLAPLHVVLALAASGGV